VKSLFITTCGRCGTRWVSKVVYQALDFKLQLPCIYDLIDKGIVVTEYPRYIFLNERTSPGNYVYTWHTSLYHLRVISKYVNIAVLVRDLRDVCVSWNFFDIKNKKITEEQFQDELISKLEKGGPSIEVIDSYIELADEINCQLIRFEDLIKDPFMGFSKLLNSFGYQYSEDNLVLAIKNNDFKTLSGGRETGEQDVNNHYRKGIIGDWKNYLSESDNERFLSLHGDKMRFLGYA